MQCADGSSERRRFGLSFPGPVAARIEAAAAALGLTGPQLLRMMVHEHLREYEARAAAARGETTMEPKK